MKKIISGLISSVFLTGLLLGTAAASGDDHYEYEDRYEHSRLYNPYYSSNGNVRIHGNGYNNNGYRNHEMYEYNDDHYRYRNTVRNLHVNPYYKSGYYGNGYYDNGYRNHELYEHGFRR